MGVLDLSGETVANTDSKRCWSALFHQITQHDFTRTFVPCQGMSYASQKKAQQVNHGLTKRLFGWSVLGFTQYEIRRISISKTVESVVQPRPASLLLVKESNSAMGPPKPKRNTLTDPMTNCTPLPKTTKQVWANQLTRLPCQMVHVKFHFLHTSTSKVDSRLLLASFYVNGVLRRHSMGAEG